MKIHTVFAAAALVALAASPFAIAEEVSTTAAMPPAPQSEAEMAVEGKALYAHHCSHCHGFNMVNAGSVAYDLRQFPHNDKARFVHSVTEGKNGRMPQWGDLLKPQEIDDIWAYVLTGGTP
jgi:mono/diheme cytochrome c family protein